jgi:hypothetical protein
MIAVCIVVDWLKLASLIEVFVVLSENEWTRRNAC